MSPAPAQDPAQRLAEALELANIPTLLMVIVQLTGDLSWLEEPFRPTPARGLTDNDSGGLPEPVQTQVRAAALEAILAWRGGRPIALPAPSEELLLRMMSVAMGEEIPAEYAPMMARQLRLGPADGGARRAAPAGSPAPAGFRVLVIGGGVSGLCAAIKLQQAGIPYTLVEKNDTVGGSWLENRYPGCGVDTPSHLYSYSFVDYDWPHYFSSRDTLHAYLEQMATDFEVRPHVRLSTEVLGMRWDEGAQEWAVRLRTAGGGDEPLRANVVISAVGAFGRPFTPDIDGLDDFAGPVCHTARWPDGLDLTGKHVALVGNGASAMQLGPAIVDRVASLTVFQRSPQWAAPFEKLHRPVPEAIRFLLAEFPLYAAWYRLRLGWIFNDRLHPSLQKDPRWPHPERSVNAINDGHREFFTRYLQAELGDRTDLVEAVLPDYPPFGKRMLLDNGWFRTLTRDNVELVTERIDHVDPDAIVTQDGTAHEADVLVLATGFDVVRFLAPMDIQGRSGRTLRETWDDDNAMAYLGMMVPDFPNFFCLYGPNTQPGHGGSLINTTESQVHYVVALLREMFDRGITSAACREDVYDAYNARVDAAHDGMIWTHPGMDTYYRNARGRVVVNSPWRNVDFWHMTRTPDLEEFVVEQGAASPL